jgi:hypothetical protein
MAKLTDAIEKKIQSVVYHYENIVKSAQQTMLSPGALPHDILDEILNHTVRERKMFSFINYALDLFQV